MTRAVVSRVPTWTAPSWLRYSTAPKPNRLPFLSGPPTDPATCWRSNGGAIQAAVGRDRRACMASSRKNIDAEPCNASPPERVTTLMTEPAERPRSAANRLVAIWNSCTPSWTTLSSGPPTISSLLSMPSMVMLPPRPSCPADEMTTELVFVGSKFGAGALPGTSSASSMKLRPLSGSRSIDGAVITASTTDRAVSTSPTLAASTTMSSFTPATVSEASRSSTCPMRNSTDSKRCGAKPDAVTVTTYVVGGKSASRY